MGAVARRDDGQGAGGEKLVAAAVLAFAQGRLETIVENGEVTAVDTPLRIGQLAHDQFGIAARLDEGQDGHAVGGREQARHIRGAGGLAGTGEGGETEAQYGRKAEHVSRTH